MKCERFISQIDDFVDSAMPAAERQKMEEHLRICAKCREELQALESLLDRSSKLCETPNRDLWPTIVAGIAVAGPPEKASILRTSASDPMPGSIFSPEGSRWIWRLGAVALLGTMLVLAATYLRNRPPEPASKTTQGTADTVGSLRNLKEQPVTDTQAMSGESKSSQTQPNASQSGSSGNYAQACQCGPSLEIADLIDKAWIVDKNLPSQREREIVSERLYNLAGENAENFFLHKASIETRSFPLRVAYNLTQRYRTKLTQQPNDAVWTYLYAYSLFGKDTPEMIRLMRQLIADHPEFPWPNLVLAEVYGLFSYKDENKARANLQAFMKLCPESPEPTPLLVALGNSEFLADAISRMRANLATRSDIRSLLLYQDLWYLEALRGATGEEISKVQQRIREDLKRLQSFEASRHGRLAQVIRSGFFDVGDGVTFRDLFDKDRSLSGRWGAVMGEMQEWDKANPVPPNDAPAENRTAYWESRLRASESWIKRIPENPSMWIIKLEALAALRNHSESEFLEAAANVLVLERDGAETPELGSHLLWKSNILKLASLYADRGIFLDQVPALIGEGYAAAERYSQENATDLAPIPQWALLMRRFSTWLETGDAWHSLAAAYLRAGKPDKASNALDSIEPGLREFKTLLAQAQADAKPDDNAITKAQRQSMADRLANREEQYAAARASIRQAARK
jgi:hypothetical protein